MHDYRRLLMCLTIAANLVWINANAADNSTKVKQVANVEKLLMMAVTVNGDDGGSWIFFEKNKVLYVEHEAFTEWRVSVEGTKKPIHFKGRKFWPLSAVPGHTAKIDFSTLSVKLTFPAQYFTGVRLTNSELKAPEVSPVLPSVFFNYDTNFAYSDLRDAPDTQDLSMLTEIGFSNQLGVLTHSSVGRNLTGSRTLGAKKEWVRLETTFTKDFPDKKITVRLGDSATRNTVFGRDTFFGGIQIGKNFALAPGYVTRPTPKISGLSTTPSTVELYVNDVLRQVSEVPTGPFVIQNPGIFTGSGDARIVVRDLLGRQTVIEQPFLASSELLKKGLDDWSVEAGKIRLDLGNKNALYGDSFLNGFLRSGITDRLTLEGRYAKTPALDLLQIGATSALPLNILGRIALVGSRQSDLGNGHQWLVGAEYQGIHFSGSLQAQEASSTFRDLGQPIDVLPVENQIAGNLSYTSERFGAFGIGFASINFNDETTTTYSGNYSINFANNSYLSIFASHAQTGNLENDTVGVNVVVPLDNNVVAGAYANSANDLTDIYATLARSPTQENPLGWRLLAGQQQNNSRQEANAYYQGQYGNMYADISHNNRQTAMRVGASGGVVAVDGNVFATQRVNGSFALAEVEGYENVGVGIGSNIQTVTNAKGVALIPKLAPYQVNSIRLSANDLPVSAELDSIEQDAVPAWRSAVKVTFPVRSGRGALLKIQMEDGTMAPIGATVTVKEDDKIFYVGRRGQAFVTGLKEEDKVIVTWQGQQCRSHVTLPPLVKDDIPRIGPLICRSISQ